MATLPIEYPTPEDFDIEESELIPGQIVGSFQTYPADAFSNQTIVRTYKIPFDSTTDGAVGPLPDFIAQVLGSATLDNGEQIIRILPWTEFYFRHLCASRVDIGTQNYRGLDPNSEGGEGSGGLPPEVPTLPPIRSSNLYKWLIMRVHFASPRFRLGERTSPSSQTGAQPHISEAQRFCTKEVKPGIQFFTVKPGAFAWDASSGKTGADALINFEIPQVQSFEDIIVWWLGVPLDAVPIDAIEDCKGKCNEDWLVLPEIPPPDSYEPETLTLHSHAIVDDFFPNGDRCAHICYVFKRKRTSFTDAQEEFGFNGYLYPGTNTYYRVKRVAGTDKSGANYIGLVPTTNFDNLFIPQP